MQPASEETLYRMFHWTARVLSLAFVGTIALFALGEGVHVTRFTLLEGLLFGFFPIGVTLGLLLSWRYERLGALISLGSLGAFYLIHLLGAHEIPDGPFFLLFTSPALLFMPAGVMRKGIRLA